MAELERIRYQIGELTVPVEWVEHPGHWLERQAQVHALRWLLVHADDGVIWGEVRAGKLYLSMQVFSDCSPPLRADTVQALRLFDESGELHLWRLDEGNWAARLISDGRGESVESWVEPYLLWGSEVLAAQDGFSLLQQGAQGLRHAPPLSVSAAGPVQRVPKPLTQAIVRHYVAYDEQGQARVAVSRLVSLSARRQEGVA